MENCRFIVTNNSFSRKIRLFKIKNCPDYEFEIIKGKLFINGHEYEVAGFDGSPNSIFHYNEDSINSLCTCLDSFSERPVVITLEGCIRLEQVMF